MSKKCGSGATKREIAKADTDDGAVVATTMSSFTPLQKALKRFCEKYPRYVKFALCNWAARLVAYWFPNALLHICYRFNFFSKYKINKGMPSTSLIVEAFLENIKGDLLAMPLVFFGVLKLFEYRFSSSKEKSGEGEEIGGDGKDGESTTTTTTETEGGQRRGWVNLRFKGPFPSVKTVLWQVLFSYFVYDTMFYWSHRWLHQKSNYLRFHKQHHRFAKTIGIASSFQHPVEGAIQLMAWYLPIGLAGWLKGDLHWSSLFSYNCFRWCVQDNVVNVLVKRQQPSLRAHSHACMYDAIVIAFRNSYALSLAPLLLPGLKPLTLIVATISRGLRFPFFRFSAGP